MDNVINQLASFRFVENFAIVPQENQPPNEQHKMSEDMSAEDTGGCDWTVENEVDHFESRIDEDGPSCSTSAERRTLPNRNRRASSLFKVQQHAIVKKERKSKLSPSCVKLNSKQVHQLYTKQSLIKCTPTNLETIFEEPRQLKPHEDARDIGLAKIKRAIAFKNGFEITKTLRNKRRARVKKFFGRHAVRRIGPTKGEEMRKFIERMDSVLKEDADEER